MDDLKYKGYQGSVEISQEDGCLHGAIQFINDIITYEGSTVPELVQNFQASVDRYLDYCARTGKEPNKPFSGSFNVRIGPERHKLVATEARQQQTSINDVICKVIDCTLGNEKDSNVMRHVHTVQHLLISQQMEVPFNHEGKQWQTQIHPQSLAFN